LLYVTHSYIKNRLLAKAAHMHVVCISVVVHNTAQNTYVSSRQSSIRYCQHAHTLTHT